MNKHKQIPDIFTLPLRILPPNGGGGVSISNLTKPNLSWKGPKVVRIIFFSAFPIFFSKLKIEGILDQIF